MNTRSRLVLLTWMILAAGLGLSAAQGQTKAPESEEIVVVDKVVANPAKFKGTVSVSGRLAKARANGLFALACEDACVAMPVKFSGNLPRAGSDVVVRGQVSKDPSGRYVFNAESVTAKK